MVYLQFSDIIGGLKGSVLFNLGSRNPLQNNSFLLHNSSTGEYKGLFPKFHRNGFYSGFVSESVHLRIIQALFTLLNQKMFITHLITERCKYDIVNWKTCDNIQDACKYFLGIHEQLQSKFNLEPIVLSFTRSQTSAWNEAVRK